MEFISRADAVGTISGTEQEGIDMITLHTVKG